MKNKALLIFLFFFVFLSSLFSEKAGWYTSSFLGEKDGLNEIINENDLKAFTSLYPKSSIIEITKTDNERKTIVEVASPLNDKIINRDLLLTTAALEELGVYGIGDFEVNVKLIEIGEEKSKKETGWYSIYSSPILDFNDAFSIYLSLQNQNFKPRVETSSLGLIILVPYVREFEKDKTFEILKDEGLKNLRLEVAENPFYL